MQGKWGCIKVIGAAFLVQVAAIGFSFQGNAQEGKALTHLAVPVGQSLPMGLQHGLTAGKSHVGAPVEAYTTQRVPVAAGSFLPAGATLTGVVTESVRGVAGKPSSLGLRFTALHWHGQTLPLQVQVVALANKAWVDGASKPVLGGADRGSSSGSSWTTEQIGGDALMRSGWSGQLVDAHGHKVGFSDFNGVYAYPAGSAGNAAKTRSEVGAGELTLARALGPFSAAAKGPYGYGEDATLQQGPNGSVVQASGKLEIRHGDALLVQVIPSEAAGAH